MCDPRQRMPVCLVKSGECPGESRKGNAAIHHWIIFNIPAIIESDELMPNDLRINPKGDYRQPENNKKIRSCECGNVAVLERFSDETVGRGGNINLSVLRSYFSHRVCAHHNRTNKR